MSAQPDYLPPFMVEPVLLRIGVGEGLCAVAEARALAGELREARRAMRTVNEILEEVTRYAAQGRSPGDAELDSRLKALRHQARNVETVLKLLE